MATNYFVSAETAARYARARPELNSEFNPRLLEHTGNLGRALDVGCGTGISSRALTRVAGEVHGVDPSWVMLSEASPDANIFYCLGVGENLPYADRSFDLLGVGLALHWFDREAFLAEAARVLRSTGWLFIADTWFGGTMRGVPEFSDWMRASYLQRYPDPPLNREPIANEGAAQFGFAIADRCELEREVTMTCEGLATYLTTQSNVTAGLERSGESLKGATDWLVSELEHFFGSGGRTMPFGGSATLLRYSAAEP